MQSNKGNEVIISISLRQLHLLLLESSVLIQKFVSFVVYQLCDRYSALN